MSYLNPFNLVTFAIGLALLIYGAVEYQLPDWDIPISIIMATLTYLTAPIAIRIVLTTYKTVGEKFLLSIYAGFLMWLSVDGSYFIYWLIVNPDALELRSAQFLTSVCLYLICGVMWYKHPQPTKEDNVKPYCFHWCDWKKPCPICDKHREYRY